MAKNFTLKELSEIFHNTESTKDKMLRAGPNLERNTTVHQGTGKKLTQYCKLYEKKVASTI